MLSPDHTGNIRLRIGELVNLVCFKRFKDYPEKYVTAQCVLHREFQIKSLKLDIATVKCNENVDTESKKFEGSNPSVATYVQYGLTYDNKFAKVLEIYVNTTNKRPLLSRHSVGPGATKAFKKNNNINFTFRKDGLYETKIFYKNHKHIICDSILKFTSAQQRRDCEAKYFNAHTLYLAGGHLAPAADFEYRSGYWSSYSVGNAAPQWQSINQGHWLMMEHQVRKMAETLKRRIEVMTGTLKVLELRNQTDHLVPITLGLDGTMPVPALFYKLIIDREAMRAVAIVMLNNPFEAPTQQNIICSDKTSLIEWLPFLFDVQGKKKTRAIRTTQNFIKKGYVYACSLDNFLNNISDLPVLDELRTQSFSLLIN